MSETKTLEEFASKFCTENFKIFSTEYWTWSVRPSQPTLGSGIISLNRYALHLSEVTPKEMADLQRLVAKLENAVKSTFDYNIMNYLMLMMVDHHVHYHVIPRYDGTREFADLKWVDNGWPALPALTDNQHQEQPDLLLKIKDALILKA